MSSSTDASTTAPAGAPKDAPDEVRTWLGDLYSAVDGMDAAGFAAFFADQGRLSFGNWDPLTGPQAVEAAIDEFYEAIDGLDHDIQRIWTPTDAAVHIEAAVTYTRLDGDEVTVPAAVHFTRGEEAIQDMRVYVDQGPVFE